MILFILKSKDSFINREKLKNEQQTKLKIILKNQKDLQMQVARIRHTIEKVLDEDALLPKQVP